MTLSQFIIFLSVVLVIIFHTCDAEKANVSSRTETTRKLCPAVERCLAMMDAGKKCAPLPVPDRARFPLVATFTVKKLRPGVWAFLDLAYISLIMYRNDKLALVDFPEASNENGLPYVTDAVLKVLKGRKPKKIVMIYSHSHYDHIGGATRFYNWAREIYPDARIRVWGTRDSRQVIRKSRTKRAIEPDVIIKRGAVLKMGGGLRVKLTVVGGHTPEDVLLYIPRDGRLPGIAMLIDIVFPKWAPFFNLAVTQDVTRFLEVQKLILKLRFDIFIGGHLQLGTKSDVMESYQFGKDIVKVVDEAFDVSQEELAETRIGELFDPTSRVFGNIWFAFRERLNLEEEQCVRTMIEKWGCRIGGVDITIKSHCFIAREHRSLEV